MRGARSVIGALLAAIALVALVATAAQPRGTAGFYVAGGITMLLGALGVLLLSDRRAARASGDQDAGIRGVLREALHAPLWWARSQGASGSQRPVWMILVFAVGFVSAIVSFATLARVADLFVASGCLAGIIVIDVWLVRERRRDLKAGVGST